MAGHRNNDSGAVCESGPWSGTQEVQITTEVTAKLKERLIEQGYRVVDLDEFDTRLAELEADVFLSLHVDSCVDWPGTTGFKVARAANSAIPEVEDRLVACINEAYEAETGLPRHDSSITHDMTDYHAFRLIASTTPAAIIELGFLYHDHALLTEHPEQAMRGLFAGITCFEPPP